MIDELTTAVFNISQATKNNLYFLIKWLGFFWVIFIVDCLLNHKLPYYLGIVPRRLRGSLGIICAPFLHANVNHLFFNSIPLLVLSDFLLVKGKLYFYLATLIIALTSGVLIWCFARPGIHIGASALITGFWSLLIPEALYRPSYTDLFLAILSVYYFFGIVYGLIPNKREISWEGHLFGLFAGVFCAYILPFISHFILNCSDNGCRFLFNTFFF